MAGAAIGADIAAAISDFVFPPLRLTVEDERWPLAAPFRIARGSKTEAHVLVVTLETFGAHPNRGAGEAVPYARYGETMANAKAALHALVPMLARGVGHFAALGMLPAGAARNALDCALVRLRAALCGQDVASLLGVPAFAPVPGAITISLDEPEIMASEASRLRDMPLLKLKLGDGARDAARLHAVRNAAPDARLVIDANEGWSLADLDRLSPLAADLGVELIEQPLPAAADQALGHHHGAVPLCADESCHGEGDPAALRSRYSAVNIKLDKAGGLIAACRLIAGARAVGLDVMLGSMVATSLSMAAAGLLAPCARWVDLDSPLLLARDRTGGIEITRGWITGLGTL